MYRLKGGKFGFAETVSANKVTANQKAAEPLDVSTVEGQKAEAYLLGSDDDDENSDTVLSEYPLILCFGLKGRTYFLTIKKDVYTLTSGGNNLIYGEGFLLKCQ